MTNPVKHFLHSAKKLLTRRSGLSIVEIPKLFTQYAPNSSGLYSDLSRLTIAGIQNFPMLLCKLDKFLGTNHCLDLKSISSLSTPSESYFKEVFDKHGSDKAKTHHYHKFYSYVHEYMLRSPSKILEIGIGTNNTSLISTMGTFGVPGASLRSFSEIYPNADVYGADIDTSILINYGRIKSFYVDQMNEDSLNSLSLNVGPDIDLVIDDGLHSPYANLQTMLVLLPLLSQKGCYVIEDISPSSIEIWTHISSILSSSYQICCFLAEGDSLVVCITKHRI